MPVPIPVNEKERLSALQQYHVLDTQPEQSFDEITKLAGQICQTPMASITFIDETRQWHKSNLGNDHVEVAREFSFCAHTVTGNDLLLVPDATQDERFRDNPLVTGESGIRFYAGVPLVTPEGLSVGSLCVFDHVPRELSAQQLQALSTLSRQVVAQLELRPDFSRDEFVGSELQSRQKRLEQRRLDRRALREQEQHNDVLLDLSPSAVIVMDASGKIVEWNPAAHAIFGHERSQVIGRILADLIASPSFRQGYMELFGRYSQVKENCFLERNVEVRLIRADGNEFPAELSIARYGDIENPLFVSFLNDISPRKKVESAMQRAADELEQHVIARTAELSQANVRLEAIAQRLGSVLESISDAFVALDADWRFTYVNDQALRMMKKTREELLGHDMWESFPAEVHCLFAEELCRAVRSGQPVTLESYFAPWKIWVEIHAYPASDGLSIYFQDISVRRANQFALEEAKREADAANVAKSEFLGRISHELRTPLNAILGFGQVLEGQDLTPMQCESVGHILKSGQHLLELINEVLDISRVEAGHIELHLEPLDLANAIFEACALIRPLADARSIVLRFPSPSDETVPYICADSQRFAQVMINLLSNAIKYNFERGEVEVSWHALGNDRWQINVRDSGPGIEPENLARLFVPFERGAARESKVEGTGLGLSLTLSLVEAMGGEISVESESGRGSVFSVIMPRTKAPANAVLPPAPLAQNASTSAPDDRRHLVLCIEDNPSNLRLIELFISSRPEISLISAANGQEGIRLARGHEPELILLDLNLPDIHGSQVLKRLRQSALTRDIPVIVVSADATTTQIEQLLNAGATRYLTKPLDMHVLLQNLEQILQLN